MTTNCLLGAKAQANSEMQVINTDDTVTVGQCPNEETDKSHTIGTADSLLGDHAQLWILKGHRKTGIPSVKGNQIEERLGTMPSEKYLSVGG